VVLIYARGRSGNSLWDFCRRRGWDNDVQVVRDLDVLTRLVRAGKVEILLCASLSGLGRSVPELVQVLTEFVAHKVALIIPSAGIDTSKVPGKVLTGMLDAISEFKRAVAVESISASLARARGVRLGRPEKVAAYRKDVHRLRARGLTGRAIAKEIGVPSANVFKLIKGASVR
jgi:DNA invertase Pin-like site-specific DNA recombinase